MKFKHQHLASRVREISRQTPGKIALQYPGRAITYQELERASNGIANFLYARIKGESPGEVLQPVCILLDRSPELIEVILGALKCGLIFVPINIHTPPARIKQLCKEIGSRWLITSPAYYEKCKDIFAAEKKRPAVLFVEQCREEKEEFELIYNKYAYIYFTSGSTGVPKGILGRHLSLDHFIQWEIREFDVDETFNVSQLTIPSFDPCLRDIFVPLSTGGTCCIPTAETFMDPASLIKWIDDQHIHIIHLVPSLFKFLVREISADHAGGFRHLKYVILAGEMLRGNDIKKWYEIFAERIQLVNFYGPTETTLIKFFYRISADDVYKSIIPAGKPMEGAQALILDDDKQKCLEGNIGEVYIRTPFISSGYYNDADLTKKVFMKNPYSNNDRDIIYKTGDLGRLLPGGDLEILGRTDHQVKIRGIRIELGEIENHLLEHPAIKEAVVVAREDERGEKYLTAYLIPNETPGHTTSPGIDNSDLKQYLSQNLPPYMIPSYFVQMEKIPLTSNGKVDKQELPEPQLTKETAYAPPRDEIEMTLVEIWSEVLGREERPLIGIDDNFFDLGGHSLRAAEMVAKVHKKFDAKIPLAVLFDSPSIRKLAEYIKETTENKFIAIAAAEKKEYYLLSSAQKRLFILCRGNPDDASYNIPYWKDLEEPGERERIEDCFRQLIQRHESLRTSFHMINNQPVQRIHDEVEFAIEYYNSGRQGNRERGVFLESSIREASREIGNEEDLSNTDLLPSEHSPKPPLSLSPSLPELFKDFIRPFDLSKVPLLRVGIASQEKSPVGRCLLMVDIHHIICDGFSISILMREFLALYNGERLPLLKLQYRDFAQWHNGCLRAGEIKKQEAYWQRVFASGVPILQLPLDYPRPLQRSFSGSSIHFQASLRDSRKLRDLAKTGNVTMFILLLAISNVFLSRLTGQEDIVVGTVAAGRRHADLEPVMGMFVNTLALRNYPSEHLTFNEFLLQVKQRTLEAFENQDYQFEDLVEKVLPNYRDPSRNPLFDVLFMCLSNPVSRGRGTPAATDETHGNQENPGARETGLKRIINRYRDGKSKFDMIIGTSDMEEAISFSLAYQTKLFKQETIQRFTGYFKEVLSAVLENKNIPLKDIKISHNLEKAMSEEVYENMENEGEF